MYSPDEMFSRVWWRILAPWLAVSGVITLATALVYSEGAPVWTVYLGLTLAVLAALPGHEHWENRPR